MLVIYNSRVLNIDFSFVPRATKRDSKHVLAYVAAMMKSRRSPNEYPRIEIFKLGYMYQQIIWLDSARAGDSTQSISKLIGGPRDELT